jgi:hypothetical protein
MPVIYEITGPIGLLTRRGTAYQGAKFPDTDVTNKKELERLLKEKHIRIFTENKATAPKEGKPASNKEEVPNGSNKPDSNKNPLTGAGN